MNRRLWSVLALWLIAISGFWIYAQWQDAGVTELMQRWLLAISEARWGPLVLFGLFMLRPLFLLPITILNAFGGFLFGPLWGLIYTLIATLVSSAIAYSIGRFFGDASIATGNQGFLQRLRERSFETVLISRLIFLPGDLVNYGAGFVRVSFAGFMLATAVGGLPGLLMTVLAGASIEGVFRFDGITIRPEFLITSGLLLISSLLFAHYLRQRKLVS
jgi:uncharacterized membrane protein YdjX (TVP38/TMEM64 family)